MFTTVGEFGQVFKGIWAHMSADGNKVSEAVAVKTIKSTVDYNNAGNIFEGELFVNSVVFI